MAQDPLYRRIADDLGDQIASGALEPGSKLPSEEELATRYSASRNTVREALRWLATSGRVASKSGQGTFVAKRPAPFRTDLTAGTKTLGGGGVETPRGNDDPHQDKGDPDQGQDDRDQITVPDKQLLDVRPEVAVDAVADRLGLPRGSDVIRRRDIRTIDDVTWSLEASYYPSSFVEAGASLLISPRDIGEGTVTYLAEKLGLREVRYRCVLRVRAPDADEARRFSLPEDGRIPVFEIFRTGYDERGKPMRLTVTVCPTDCNYFIVDVDRSDSAAEEK
jgi:GntR family transcriptional regulator